MYVNVLYVCMYVCVYVCMYVCMYVCVYACVSRFIVHMRVAIDSLCQRIYFLGYWLMCDREYISLATDCSEAVATSWGSGHLLAWFCVCVFF